jgi:hypothetical protein
MKCYIDEIHNGIIRVIVDVDGYIQELFLSHQQLKEKFPCLSENVLHEGMSWVQPSLDAALPPTRSIESFKYKAPGYPKFSITTQDDVKAILKLQRKVFGGGENGSR